MVKLYVEGGGDGKALQIECRRGFREFLEKAGLKGKMPAIAACGGRRFAYEDYCTAIANGEAAMLLVDSEAPIAPAHQTGKSDEWQPRQHLKASQGDGWDRPQGKLLAKLDPAKVVAASPWAKRFVDILKQKMGA